MNIDIRLNKVTVKLIMFIMMIINDVYNIDNYKNINIDDNHDHDNSNKTALKTTIILIIAIAIMIMIN